jgi:RNAse (barnase) inhibitor barstar
MTKSLPVFRLVDESSREVLGFAEDVSGFFVAGEGGPGIITLVGANQIEPSKRKWGDVELEVLNFQRRMIGAYYVGRVVPDGPSMSCDVDELHLRFNATCEYPEAKEIWRHWASDRELEAGEWRRWPSSQYDAWLHVVQNAWFSSGKAAARYGTSSLVFLDGSRMVNVAAFYCELGEAVNGSGGYFGSNLDALADCLSAGPADTPLNIYWEHVDAARAALGEKFMESALSTMREYGVEIRAESSL